MNEFIMYVSIQQRLLFEISLTFQYDFPGVKYFTCSYKTHPNSIWITPYNNGNLWKIKVTGHIYRVYYGTTKKIYATSLKDCIDYINSPLNK